MATARDFPDGAALIVGGSGGVGRAVAAAIAAAGSDVAITYRTNARAAEDAAAAARSLGRRAEAIALDLGCADQAREVVEGVGARFGALHTVVYAAGSDIAMRFASEISPADLSLVLARDTGGFFHVVRAAIPLLRASRGSIVAVTSAGLLRCPTRDLLSIAPKAAMEAIVRTVAVEEGRFGVRANAVALGVIDAGIFLRLKAQGLDEAWLEAARRNTPLRRFGSAEEAADVIVFLASARAAFVTGQTIAVDGGYAT